MTMITAKDGVKLYVEEAGEGTPILFIHEFGGNHESWEPQLRYFSRRHRCITYAARGYPPSDVPDSVEAYSQAIAADDAVAVLDALKIEKAHIVGLSMGGFCTVHFGLRTPERALSLTVAGAGYGCEKEFEEYFRGVSLEVADNFEKQGAKEFSTVYALGASRVQFQNKDPRGWQEFADRLATHSDRGAANTMRGVQARRPSFYDLEDGLKTDDGADAGGGRRRRRSLSPARHLPEEDHSGLRALGLPQDRPHAQPRRAGGVQRAARRVHRPGRGRTLAAARSARAAGPDHAHEVGNR